MPEKKKFVVSHKTFTFFIGVLLSLFAIILVLNVGYIARTFAFPFLALFGIGSYVIYFLIYICGFCFIFKERSIKIKRKIRIPAFLLAFVGFLSLTTLIATKTDLTLVIGSGDNTSTVNFYDGFVNVFKNIPNGYYSDSFLDIFGANHFGGGLIGYLLVGLLNSLGSAVAYTISIIVFVLGVLLFLTPTIISIVKKQMAKQGVPVNEDKELKEANTPKKKEKRNSNNRVTNIDVIGDASSLPRENMESVTSPIETTSSVFSSEKEIDDSGAYYQPNGTFVLARFKTSTDQNDEPEERITLKEAAVTEEKEEDIVEEALDVDTPSPVVTSSSISQPTPKVEQMDLFSEEEEIDEELAATPHSYTEPVPLPKDPKETIPDARPRLKFIPPDVSLLSDYEEDEELKEENVRVADQRMIVINKTFESFNVGARCVSYTIGPAVTRFNIQYDYNVSVSQVKRIVDDIALRIGGETGARFTQIVAGQAYSGLEVPNANTTTVPFKEVFSSLPDVEKKPFAIGFGKEISGKTIYADYLSFPHMLLAGTTGSGKSVFVHSLIMTLIMRNSPDDMKLVLVDPKQVEMNMYDGLPHLLTPIIDNPEKAKSVMNKLCDEMERRNGIFKKVRVTQIKTYNEWAIENGKDKLPYIFVIFDEYADCHDVCKDIELPIRRLAQKARSAGIHILLATQRPSVDVVTGTLKGNLPTHVALLTASSTDSMVILGEGGAEQLLGKGDMLIQVPGFSRGGSIRVQSPFVSDAEINAVVSYLVDNYPTSYDPNYDTVEEEASQMAQILSSPVPGSSSDNSEDELYAAVKAWAMTQDYVSMSRIQREFSTGFNRAGRLFKRLQTEGIVAPKPDTASSAKGCRVLIKEDKFASGESEDEDEEEVNTGE